MKASMPQPLGTAAILPADTPPEMKELHITEPPSPRPGRRSRGGARPSVLITVCLLLLVTALALVLRQRDKRTTATRRVPPPAARLQSTDWFTTIPPDTVPIAWRAWSEETFAEARARDLPVVALIDAAWSESCVLYAAHLGIDSEARAALETGVIAVRVDADRRPDVHLRMCLENSALPAWVFLTPDGRTWSVADALPAAMLARRIGELRAAPRLERPDPGLEMLRRTLPVLPAPANLAALPARLFAAVQAQWPAAGTDFDLDSPLLEVDALEFVHAYGEQNHSVAARAIYIDTVRRLAASIDSTGSILQEVLPAPGRIMQGRFLATHAMLLDHFLAVAALENDAACASAAQRVASWMATVLFEPRSGLFRAAQGTLAIEAGKAVLTSAERARMQGGGHARFPAPAVVPFAPTGANAHAAAALSRFPGKTADAERFRGLGRRVFAVLSAAPRPGGRVPHDYALTPAGGLQPGEIDTAADAAEWGLALLAAAPALSADVRATRLAAARALGDGLLTRFAANDIGAFYDVPPPDSLAPERARLRLAPLADNARVSLFLIELARATGQAPYRDAGVRALEAWGYSVRGQSPWTASLYGTAVLAALRH